VIWIKRVALFICAAALAGGAALALTEPSGLFLVRSIPVEIVAGADAGEGAFRADEATVGALRARLQGRVKAFEKKKIWEIDIEKLGALVRADEWVRQARISRAFPNRLEVAIAPRAPVFLLATSRNELLPITADASIVAPVEDSLLPDVPVLRGDRFLADAEMRRKAVAFARQFPIEGPLRLSRIAEMSWSQNDGFAILLLPSRTEVKFGEDRIGLKIARVEQIIDYLNAHQLKGRVIDASFSKKVLVRLRKGP